MSIEYLEKGKQYVYVYSQNKQYYEVYMRPGVYKIECWGASGGIPPQSDGGYGAYTSGILDVTTSMKLFVVLGEEGRYSDVNVATYSSTFNGGGAGGIASKNSAYGAGSGGGATDIRLNFTGSWSDFESLKSRIMVAAGGAGTTHYDGYYFSASGGSLNGNPGDYYEKRSTMKPSTGASQSEGGKGCNGDISDGKDGEFGIGGNWGGTHCSSGGGGGYFGGGGGGISDMVHCSGSSGSSYISGYSNCHSIKKDATKARPETEDNPIHYSNIYFMKPEMIDGDNEMPSLSSTSQYKRSGSGAVRIYYFDDPKIHTRTCYSISIVYILVLFIVKS